MGDLNDRMAGRIVPGIDAARETAQTMAHARWNDPAPPGAGMLVAVVGLCVLVRDLEQRVAALEARMPQDDAT